MSKEYQNYTQRKWNVVHVSVAAVVAILGILQLLMPNIIEVQNSTAGQFGLIVMIGALIAVAFYVVVAYNARGRLRLGVSILALFCLAVALLGYAAFWWFS